MSDPRVRPPKPAHPDLSSAPMLGHGHPFAPRTGRCRKNIQIGPWGRATRAFAVVFSRNEGPTGPRRTQTARTGVRWQCQARHADRAKKAAAPSSRLPAARAWTTGQSKMAQSKNAYGNALGGNRPSGRQGRGAGRFLPGMPARGRRVADAAGLGLSCARDAATAAPTRS